MRIEETELLEKLSVLEKKVMKLDNESIQKVFQEIHNYDVLVQCVYGFRQDPREKIMDNLSDSYGMMERVVFMEFLQDLGWRKTEEKDILKAVLRMNEIIDRLDNPEAAGKPDNSGVTDRTDHSDSIICW